MEDRNRKKIVYVMNVEWNWIKQRPHFIAERLSGEYDVYIVYQYGYNRKGLQHRTEGGLKLYPIKLIPKISRIRSLKWINDYLLSSKVKRIISEVNPDCLYFTYPTQVNMIPADYVGKVIYDCMDNHTAFVSDLGWKQELEEKEKDLIKASNYVLVSSEYLRRVLIGKYGEESKFILVRNAYDGKILGNLEDKKISSPFRMAYIGTISTWFDWKTISYVIDNASDVELHLYGPIGKLTDIPSHERIYYHGTVEHDKLYETIKGMDCLIMPFVINDIIKAVDPVKIYEYINFNKDIIMCSYEEVERFRDFVYFYNNGDDFLDAIKCIRESKKLKYSDNMRRSFLKSNDWEARKEQIIQIL